MLKLSGAQMFAHSGAWVFAAGGAALRYDGANPFSVAALAYGVIVFAYFAIRKVWS